MTRTLDSIADLQSREPEGCETLRHTRDSYGWIIVFSSFVTLMMVSSVNQSFSIFLVPLSNDFGWDRASVSIAPSLNMIGLVISLPVVGKIADKYGSKKLILTGVILNGLSTILLSMISNLWHLYVLYGIIGGICYTSAGMIPNTALIANWFSKKRALAFSIFLSGFCLGPLIFTPFSAYVITLYGWRIGYLILGSLLLVTVVPIVIFLVRDRPQENEDSPQATNHISVQSERKHTIERETTLLQTLRNKYFLLLAGIHFICGITDVPVTIHLIAFAIDVNITEIYAATALSIMNGMSFLGTLFMGNISEKIGRKYALTSIYLVRALSLFILLRTNNLPMLYLFSILSGLVYFSMVPLFSSLIGDAYGIRSIGKLTGFLSSIHAVGASLGTYALGAIYNSYSSYFWGFLAMTFLSLIASVSCYFLNDKWDS